MRGAVRDTNHVGRVAAILHAVIERGCTVNAKDTPWVALKTASRFGSWGVYTAKDHYSVLDNSAPHANSEEHAKLMAAAPELLAALHSVMEEMKSRFDYETPTPEEEAAFCKADAAIEKAEGKE